MNISSLHDDSAENSIMQTITIAVSAILIAAGLVTAPGLINNARDNNATTELANIAYSQEYQLGSQGKYLDYPALIAAQEATSSEGIRGAKITPSGSVKNQTVLTCNSPTSWLASVTSSSGKTFYRSSSSANTSTNLADIKYDADCIDASGLAPTDETTPVNPPLTGTALDNAIFANPSAYCPSVELTDDEKEWVNLRIDSYGTIGGHYKGEEGNVAPGGYGWVSYADRYGTQVKQYQKSSNDRVPLRTDGPTNIQRNVAADYTECFWSTPDYVFDSAVNNGGPSSIGFDSETISISYTNSDGNYHRTDGPAIVTYDVAQKKIIESVHYINGRFDDTQENIIR